MKFTEEQIEQLDHASHHASVAMNAGAQQLAEVYLLLQQAGKDDLALLVYDLNEEINEAAAKAMAATNAVPSAGEDGFDIEVALKATDFLIEQQLSVLPNVLEDLMDLILDVDAETRGAVSLTYAYYRTAWVTAQDYQTLRFPTDQSYFEFLEQAFDAGELVDHPHGSEA